MVSPCIDNRINSRNKDIQFSNATQYMLGNDAVKKTAPPISYQLSTENIKLYRQPKQSSRLRGINNASSNKRQLGNVRALLLNSGSEELILTRKTTKSTSSSSSKEASSYSRKNDTKARSLNIKLKRGTANHKNTPSMSSNDSHFTAKSEFERRRQMTETITAMLGGMNRRRNSLKLSARREFHKQQAPDASKDPYQVHKWRQKSSRKKFSGMQGSPTFPDQTDETTEGTTKEHQSHYDRSAQLFSKKPRVPLPGVNMLPALHVYDRSHAGSTGQQEVTLAFARNAAMEEIERRFHDDSWKNKRARKSNAKHQASTSIEHESLDELLRETRRSNVLRRAASLRHGQHETDGIHKISEMQTLTSLPEANHNLTLQPHSYPDPTELKITEKEDSATYQSAVYSNMFTTLATPNTEVINYKMIADSFSEETVTIVSKPSEATSPTKYISSVLSKSSHDQDLSKTTYGSLQNLPPVALPSHRSSVRRYPVLPNFPKAEKSKFVKGAVVFDQLQKNMNTENEHQYSRSLKSHDEDSQKNTLTRTREKKMSMPPVLNSKNEGSKQTDRKFTHKKVRVVNEDLSEIVDNVSPLGTSPTRRKQANSNKTSPLSHASGVTIGPHAKDSSSTPVDSVSSRSTGGGRRRSNKWRKRSTRGDNKGSPQYHRSLKQSKMAKLMGKWRAAIRLSIMFGRLCTDHHIVADDSYNIRFGRTKEERSGTNVKREVLFDVTDYKTKNQQKPSDTTRRILSTPSVERTEQDIRMVQTALRNVKAISDHSSSVQSNIARSGYFVGFESKKVVVLENRRALNFYVLLAGSAVVIKKDENGNTNPVWFMKRGDVFGEREILEDGCWEWSVVTVDPCEFLLLDKQEYLHIFLAGGGGGLLNDPDRGTFLRKLSLFRGWPTQLLESNPNRCLFRYYKRGALLVRDNTQSDWIFVVKSGSCSVLKPLKVQEMTTNQIFHKQLKEQTATFPAHLVQHLVQRQEVVNEEDHLQKIQDIADTLKADQLSVATSYKQIEIATLLKELNIDMKEGLLTPVDEEDENEDGDKNVLDSYNNNTISINITEGDIEPYAPPGKPDPDFRMSRVSDRAGQPRTPSPMKAAYLQTGISSPRKEESRRKTNENTDKAENSSSETDNNAYEDDTKQTLPNVDDAKQTLPIDALSAEDFLSKLDSSSESGGSRPQSITQNLKPVYVNIRKLTKGSSFGLGPVLFNEQPSLSLISNGAECMVLHKKFYLDNMSDEVLKNLREVEHPYPSESELHESYWRLISWKAFQQRTVQGLRRHQTKVRHYLNPPKTDVY